MLSTVAAYNNLHNLIRVYPQKVVGTTLFASFEPVGEGRTRIPVLFDLHNGHAKDGWKLHLSAEALKVVRGKVGQF
jgi:hypothetical protein